MLLEVNEFVAELRICSFKIVIVFKTQRFEEILPKGMKKTDSRWYGQTQLNKEVQSDKVCSIPLLLITVHICVYFALKGFINE